MRTIETNRGTYKIVADKESLIAVSTGDNNDYYEFDNVNATDAEIRERINADTYPVGEWLTDLDNIPRGIGLLLYSGEIYEPGWGCISETDDVVISSHTDYDNCPLNHIDQYMIIPDFES